MPNLSQLTDFYDKPDNVPLPVEQPFAPTIVGNIPEVVKQPSLLDRIIANIGVAGLPEGKEKEFWKDARPILGTEENRLWPEKMVRGGISAAGNVMSGEIPQWAIDPKTGDVHTSPQMIEAGLDIAALAGTGGLAGTTDATLGSAPFLRPALKHEGKIYKGKEGQQHLDVLPKHLEQDFNEKAMSGEDVSHYEFGFMNHKGQFLKRDAALDYAVKEGLIDPSAGQYGALTSTLLSDSSKPGVAIEVMKNGGVDPVHFKSPQAATFRLAQLQRDKAASKKAGTDVNGSDYMFYNTQIRALKSYIKNPEEFNNANNKYKFVPVEGDPFK